MKSQFIVQLLVSSLIFMIPGRDWFDLHQLHFTEILRE